MDKNKIKDRPLKVLIVMESWGLGGTETFVTGLVKYLISNQVEVKIILLKDLNVVNIDGLLAKNISIVSIPKLFNKLKVDRPDLLSLHLYTNLLPVTLIGRLLSIPIISTLHMPYSAWGNRHKVYWWIATRLSNKVIGVSNKIINEVNTNNIYKNPISGGVDPLFFNTSKNLNLVSKKFNIAAVGRLGKEKDWPTLIHSVNKLPVDIQKKIRLHFYGNGSELNHLKSLANQNGIDAIFYGQLTKKDLAKKLSNADLSVLPSLFEGLPMSLLESMAAGVPMVITDFLEKNDQVITHGKNGHIFPKGNSKDLANIIYWHIKNRKKSLEIGKAGKKFVNRYYGESIAYCPYLSIFKSVINMKEN